MDERWRKCESLSSCYGHWLIWIGVSNSETFVSTNSKTTEEWFKRMSSVIHVLKASTVDADKTSVKVAVLDTGVSLDHPEGTYVDGYEDFVTGCEDRKDNSGHGTMSVRLILEMCDSASVYALRIFDKDLATDGTKELAVEVSLSSVPFTLVPHQGPVK